jgi:hypothetical protein
MKKQEVKQKAPAQEIGGAFGRRGRADRHLHGGRKRQRAALPRLRHHDLAAHATFEEVAHLLVHEELPNPTSCRATSTSWKPCAGCPPRSKRCWSRSPPPPSRWTCCAPAVRCWARSCPSAKTTTWARRATPPTACWPASLPCSIYWYHYARNGGASRWRPGRFDRRALLAPAEGHPRRTLCARAGCFADPVCRARVQRLYLHQPGDLGHRLGYLFGHHRRDWRAARLQARRRQRRRGRPDPALPQPDEAEAASADAGEQRDRAGLWPPGLHHLRPAQYHHQRICAPVVRRVRHAGPV